MALCEARYAARRRSRAAVGRRAVSSAMLPGFEGFDTAAATDSLVEDDGVCGRTDTMLGFSIDSSWK